MIPSSRLGNGTGSGCRRHGADWPRTPAPKISDRGVADDRGVESTPKRRHAPVMQPMGRLAPKRVVAALLLPSTDMVVSRGAEDAQLHA